MKHVTYADRSLLVGDEAAIALLEYAARLGARGDADTVTLQAVDSEGKDVEAIFLLNCGTVMIAESGDAELGDAEETEPDNTAATGYMQERIRRLTTSEVRPLSADDILAFKSMDIGGLD